MLIWRWGGGVEFLPSWSGKSSVLLLTNYVKKAGGDLDMEERGSGEASLPWVAVRPVSLKTEKLMFLFNACSGLF